jgi:hypothetical protein
MRDLYRAENTELDLQAKLINIRRMPMGEIWEKFFIPGTKDYYSHEELFSDFVPCYAVFEGVPLEDAFEYISKTENLVEWCATLKSARLLKGDIYEMEETVSQTGKAYIQTVANKVTKTIEWYVGHESPDNLWIYYFGLMADAQKALGRRGTAFIWVNFAHDSFKKDAQIAHLIKHMRSAHNFEINNLKMILEYRYGRKR